MMPNFAVEKAWFQNSVTKKGLQDSKVLWLLQGYKRNFCSSNNLQPGRSCSLLCPRSTTTSCNAASKTGVESSVDQR